MTLTLIELVQTGDATWDVLLGEGDHRLDISNVVEGLRLTLDSRTRLPQAVLELTAYPKFHLKADVVVDDLTAECLKQLGWTPPAPAAEEFQTNPIALPAPDGPEES